MTCTETHAALCGFLVCAYVLQLNGETGFKQWDAMSPILFNWYLHLVTQTILPLLQELGVRVVYHVHGVRGAA